ncbi:hypothetical protein O181_062263 [Austropuccinia psidii MF-1]|uniref:Integrase zinc-binding domain-containing protein n=1 Tax=Austropuccinia psidii MF-1 TaxID=1389203 RepID=A0A9Q3HZC8_9BASI|nr:hypothetical protein [Austropuccinia psidii MF-1]
MLDDAHIQGFLLGTDYQKMYGIGIYNSKNRHITIGTNKEKKFSLDIYQISAQDPLEELLNEFREGRFSTGLTSKQKLNLLKMLRKNRPELAIGEEPLGKIRGHDKELYLDVERPYPPMFRRPPYPESMQTRKEIGKHINELLDMDVIIKIGNNEIVEITTPVLITWHDGKSRLCGDLRALNNYNNAERYPIPRIPHALDKLTKARYITQMDCMKGFHQNGVEPNSMKLLRIICHMGIHELLHQDATWHQECTSPLSKDDGHYILRRNTGRLDGNYDPEVEAKIPIHFREIERKKNFGFSDWAPVSGIGDSVNTTSEGTKNLILGISSSELHTELFNALMKRYSKHKQWSILLQLLQQKDQSPELESQLQDPWLRDHKDNKFLLIDGLLFHREKQTSALTKIDRDHISLILQGCHDCPYMGHISEDRTKERVASTAWWPRWEQELSEYIKTYERFQKENRKHGKKYWLLKHMEEPKHSWETINMDWVTVLVPGGKENFNSC